MCCVGEYGEIWVSSEANVKSFYGSKDKTDIERFQGVLAKGNPNDVYVRTGDLGFLYNIQRPLGPGGLLIEVQSLFVLGSIGNTFEIDGLLYFPVDIESSVERCHKNITPGGRLVTFFFGIAYLTSNLVLYFKQVAQLSYLLKSIIKHIHHL